MKTIIAGFGAAVLASCGLFGQTTPPPPAFEVASVRPAARPAGRGMVNIGGDAGRVNFAGATLKDVLMRAYNVKGYQIAGPSWLDSEYYNIVAKVPDGVPKEQIPAMLRALLAERFQMTVRRETREQPGYALVVGKGGPKLKKSADSAAAGGAPRGPSYGIRTSGDTRFEDAYGFTLSGLAELLTNGLHQPVIDMTGIEGSYDITLEFDRDGSVFTAIQQLGLKLEPRKAPVECIVVEKAEKVPTEN
jgi:uncharacterized protein (TIGR03435 family)